jgi:hypothetical protein
MVHLPHLGKLRREVKEEVADAADGPAAASPFHKRSRLAHQQQQVRPLVFLSLRIHLLAARSTGTG